ncbi:uncharacterized protein LOC126832842 isoform X2 [Adelges cooleyi]|nr:uncharacterized protein LOC126832842 isoform X2 [Adelges cooleyi]XP_050419810.1 uncharacterized protein LOC126832842 isoform X2 [Adelges cooleyi]
MKLYYILIAFAFVNVVFAFTDILAKLGSNFIIFRVSSQSKQNFHYLTYFTEEYKKQVVHTNNHFRKAFYQEKLDNAIKFSICGTERGEYKYSMEHIKYQTDMRKEILEATTLTDPEVQPNYNFDSIELSGLMLIRRHMTKGATSYLILSNRSLPGPDFSESTFGDLCRSIGVYKSIINPNSYIISAVVDNSNKCTLTAVDNSVSKYKPINRNVYRVDVDPAIKLSREVEANQNIE